MKQFHFFGLREDMVPILEAVESKGRLKYIPMGNFLKDELNDEICEFDTGRGLPNLGIATADQSGNCDSYLVLDVQTPVNLRTLQGFDSRQRVLIDQLLNPDSVTFISGGVWNDGVVISGSLGTASDSNAAQTLMRRFHSAIRKVFTKVGAYYVGPEALALWKRGARLTDAVQSPPEFDLAPPEGEK
jgi:hypothetical protein